MKHKSKTNLLFLFLSFFLLIGVGCAKAKGNENVDADGNCTQGYIDAYNGVVEKFKVYNSFLEGDKINQELEEFKKVMKAAVDQCDAFLSQKAGVTCVAINSKSKEVGPVMTNNHEENCKHLKSSYRKFQTESKGSEE